MYLNTALAPIHTVWPTFTTNQFPADNIEPPSIQGSLAIREGGVRTLLIVLIPCEIQSRKNPGGVLLNVIEFSSSKKRDVIKGIKSISWRHLDEKAMWGTDFIL